MGQTNNTAQAEPVLVPEERDLQVLELCQHLSARSKCHLLSLCGVGLLTLLMLQGRLDCGRRYYRYVVYRNRGWYDTCKVSGFYGRVQGSNKSDEKVYAIVCLFVIRCWCLLLSHPVELVGT